MGCHIVKELSSIMNKKEIVDTQPEPETQTQTQATWVDLESQPIGKIVWGRLYSKSANLKSLDLCNENFAAGRDESNDLMLTLKELPEKVLARISKIHFQIKKDLADPTNPVYIEDKSRNGTFVNYERIGYQQKRILSNNDLISLSHPTYKAFIYHDLSPSESHGLPEDICRKYHVGRKLGSGACGVVRQVHDRETCHPYAMKHIQKNQLVTATDPARIMNEVSIMKSLQHPCVIKMHDIIDNTDSVYIVLELMKGGDLLNRILKEKKLSEQISKLFFLQMCRAVKYLHDKNITHRDLKPDNVLLESTDEETLIKVSDFGLSKFVQNDSVMRTLCGTPLYVAPEVLLTGGRGTYTKKVDIWSLGVVLFTCLSATLPFSDEYGTPATEQIKRGHFSYRSAVWRTISPAAKSLIQRMLTVDPKRRLSIDDVLRDRWLKDEETIRKVNKLMRITTSETVEQENVDVGDDKFLQPPAAKRRRVDRP